MGSKWYDPEFRAKYQRSWYKAHKKAANKQSAKWAKDHPERMLQFQRRWKFGLSFDEQKTLMSKPCMICNGKGTHIDHDHKTNKVRGVLCNNCNTGLGMFKDSSELLTSACKYLYNAEMVRQKLEAKNEQA